ncbi:MAG: dTMP kinase [Patescibacteria group bacterium]
MVKGIYIGLDGIDGAGKTSLKKSLPKILYGREVVVTHQPGGTPLADLIRVPILSKEAKRSDPLTQMLLHFAARHENIEDVVKPALARGAIVISDRTEAATYAYQLHGQLAEVEWGTKKREQLVELFHELSIMVLGDCCPDAYFYLDISPAEGKRRKMLAAGEEPPNHFDERDFTFHERLRDGYREYGSHVRKTGRQFFVINAMYTESEVRTDFHAKLRNLLVSDLGIGI